MTDPTPLSPAAQAVRDAALANYLDKQPLWVIALMIFDSTPGPDYVAMCAVLERIADEIEARGDKGLDLDPGETAEWLREEANVTKAAKDYHG